MKKVNFISLCLIFFVRGMAFSAVSFYQSDFTLDGASYTNTDWGSLDFTYTGSSNVMYLNVAVNGSWEIQNIPVLSQNGVGVTHTKSYDFDLGVASGTPVSSLSHDHSLTASPVGTMPGGSTSVSVGDRSFAISSGVTNAAIPALSAAAGLIGHVVVGPAHGNSNFPNQDCGLNKCTPAAVSNSIQFLNEKKKLGIDPADITIDKMIDATKWEPDGCWIDKGTGHNAWWEDKDAYMKANNLPITTRKITDLSKLGSELDDDQDIELQGDWHTAAIVGLTELANGCYAIDVSHDTQQGITGGTMVQTTVYCPTTDKFVGSPGFLNDSGFRYAIVECQVPAPGAIVLASFGCGFVGWLKRRRSL